MKQARIDKEHQIFHDRVNSGDSVPNSTDEDLRLKQGRYCHTVS